MELNILRSQINEIDEKLIDLLNKRLKIALHIGKIKTEQKLPVFNETREKEVLDFVKTKNTGPLKEDQVETIFQMIMEICRNAQHQSRKD